ncbi:RagB/SusD family nutrient uptake outer membrane protein [Pseudoflavitalea sp. G-6-1-2]|uniref:RagB/SusD family nutrient uptake outer membrane protein n=1 Tax=Pseudoflavitalea sp. G-6-1-2 TaxID=2728841 RepID=UPI001469A609|nr:RagB/SusD family nutrient uptake outer membrane protein [Pseudoflavitalea sp. G-6-1-2]NML19249.1 RagB/SusD family nutrient uptake outer membrane protein [Pseudoflavitalea sp. G-6-1-2]
MNKFTNSIMVAGLVVLGLTSCKKSLLEQLSPDQLTTDNFYTNKERALSGLASAYSQIEDFVGWDQYVEARSVREFYREDFVVPGADASNYPWWTDHYYFTFTSGNPAIGHIWTCQYRGINFANQVIEGVAAMKPETIDEAARKMITAEAKFLRAYYHFRLLQNFERIIIRDKYPTSGTDLPKALSSRAEAYDFILNDLKAALADLPLRSARPGTELGRITKGTAESYIGKVYLHRAGDEAANAPAYYEQARIALNNVITSNEYQLEANFMGMFNGTIKNSKESIFELQQTADASGGAYFRSFLADWIAASEMNGYGEIYATPRLITEMTKEGTPGNRDPRAYGTMVFEDPYFKDPVAKRAYGYTYNDIFGDGSGIASFRKWIPADIANLGRSLGINMPLMRYADVMLMYAEVLNNQAKYGDANTQINNLRTNRGMTALNLTTKTEIFDQIRHERVMEFTLEGSRFYDLRRWGLLEQNMQAAGRSFSAEKAFYPIPLTEIQSNPLIKQ